MLTLIASIDEFKGEWRGLGPETLRSPRRIAAIDNAASSTRVEGAKLIDGEVDGLLGKLGSESFKSRDELEVAGYAYVMDAIQTAWSDLRISESILLRLHRDLLRYSDKDERQRAGGSRSTTTSRPSTPRANKSAACSRPPRLSRPRC
jgi:hypothetical protein